LRNGEEYAPSAAEAEFYALLPSPYNKSGTALKDLLGDLGVSAVKNSGRRKRC
jgi:hypothetical protein